MKISNLIERHYMETGSTPSFCIKKTLKHTLGEYFVIALAAIIYAVAVSQFLDPNSLAPGGVTGIAIILNRITGLETGTWTLMINVPILLVGMWKFGVKFIFSTLYFTVINSLAINFFSSFGTVTDDHLLAALAGGSLIAISLGLVFKAGATSGGTDIVVKLLRLRFPYLKTGFLFLITDALIVAASGIVFKDIDTAMYAGLVVFVNSMLLDVILYGRDGAKMVFIISDFSDSITARILKELDVGVTHMTGYGAYSGREKKVILCVMRKQLYHKAEEIVRQEDPMAFMIIAGATEIYGEGYKSIFSQKL